jgi:peptidoglycan/xylan/chitin deacetylase (PgdA/CDA1 family)
MVCALAMSSIVGGIRCEMMRALLILGLCACHGHGDKPRDFGPRFLWRPGTRVPCAKGVDRTHEWTHDALSASLERAQREARVLVTFGHAPTLDFAEYARDFDWAAAHDVPSVTFAQLAAGYLGAGWAFTVDDDEVDTWVTWRDFLRAHHVHVTFFVTRYARFTPAQKQELRELAADGHDIEAHSKEHVNAVEYTAAHGLDAYVRDEVLPSRDALVADGFAPLAFAYPFGAHTHAIDEALLPYFALVRATGAESCLP